MSIASAMKRIFHVEIFVRPFFFYFLFSFLGLVFVFSLSLLWMYIQRRRERVELCSVTVRGGGGRLAEAQKSRRLSERPHDLPPLCAAARI
jgi:hypothetical protein